MNAKQILAKIKMYPLAISLIGAAILLAGWAYWRSTGALVEAHDQFDVVTQQNDSIDKNTKASELIEEQLAELNADAVKFAAGLVNPVEDITNQQYFYNLELDAGVEQITDPVHTVTERTKDPTEPSFATFSLSVSGHWDNIVSFLYGLQTGPHPMRIGMFQLAKAQQLRGTRRRGTAQSHPGGRFARQMKTSFHGLLWRPRLLLAAFAGFGLALARASAADEPAPAAPAAAPAAAPPGTWYVFSPPKDIEVLSSPLRLKMLNLARNFLERTIRGCAPACKRPKIPFTSSNRRPRAGRHAGWRSTSANPPNPPARPKCPMRTSSRPWGIFCGPPASSKAQANAS